jgi:long-subunit acyl-CoA synthetase (AMP-forming)
MVLIGRTRGIGDGEGRVRWLDMKSRNDIEVVTYDEVSERVRALAKMLRALPYKPSGEG